MGCFELVWKCRHLYFVLKQRRHTYTHTQKLVHYHFWSTSCSGDESRICISKLTNVTPPIIIFHCGWKWYCFNRWRDFPRTYDKLFSSSHQWLKMIPEIPVANGPYVVPHVRMTMWCSHITFMISDDKFQLHSYSNNSISRPNISGSWSDQTAVNMPCSQYAIHCCKYWPNLEFIRPNNSDKSPQNKWQGASSTTCIRELLLQSINSYMLINFI